MNRITLKGDWNILKGQLKQKWATLTDDDLQYREGEWDELVGRIQKRTGECRDAIERFLQESAEAGALLPRRPIWEKVDRTGMLSLLVLLVALSAVGCRNTADGFGKDVEKVGEKIQDKVN